MESTIRDLKYGVGLNHLLSGRFSANTAWLEVQVMAHNLARWTTRIGLCEPAGAPAPLVGFRLQLYDPNASAQHTVS